MTGSINRRTALRGAAGLAAAGAGGLAVPCPAGALPWGWSPWQTIVPADVNGRIGACLTGDGWLHLFWSEQHTFWTDQPELKVKHRRRGPDGVWDGSIPTLSQRRIFHVFPVSWGPGRLDLFGEEYDSERLMHRWQQAPGYWSAWENRPLGNHSEMTVCSQEPGSLDVFTVSTAQLPWTAVSWHRFRASHGWLPPLQIPGPPTDLWGHTLGATSWAPGRLDVFGRAANTGELLHIWYAGGRWREWEILAPREGNWNGHVSAVSWGPDRIDLFWADGDGQLRHKWFEGSWWYPTEIIPGAPVFSSISAVSPAPGELEVFAMGATGSGTPDGTIRHISFG